MQPLQPNRRHPKWTNPVTRYGRDMLRPSKRLTLLLCLPLAGCATRRQQVAVETESPVEIVAPATIPRDLDKMVELEATPVAAPPLADALEDASNASVADTSNQPVIPMPVVVETEAAVVETDPVDDEMDAVAVETDPVAVETDPVADSTKFRLAASPQPLPASRQPTIQTVSRQIPPPAPPDYRTVPRVTASQIESAVDPEHVEPALPVIEKPAFGFHAAQRLSVRSETSDGQTSKTLEIDAVPQPLVQEATPQLPQLESVPAEADTAKADDDAEIPVSPLMESVIEDDSIAVDLSTALSMVGGQHPAVGFARWRVQEAYAEIDAAKSLWLPSIRAGFSYHRHDGNLQASDGSIIDPNRSSLQAGLGAGGVGAGTTQRPGVVANFRTADAIFQPKIANKTSWAREHAANAAVNDQLASVASGYIRLLQATQNVRIVQESSERTAALAQLTKDFAETGQGLQADADRMATEFKLIESRLIDAREAMDVAGARLGQALSLESGQPVVPLDDTVAPIHLVSESAARASLVATGLSVRPELKEAQALVAAACERFKHQKFSPFVPSVLLGFSQTGFGGGLGNNVDDVDNRMDFDAVVTWEVRNLGIGERAARNATAARVEQAKYESIRVMDQIAPRDF